MAKADAQQTELVLENRQVIGIFLGMALVCGVFFALGYVVGRNTSSPAAAVIETNSNVAQSSEKPSAMPSPSYMQRAPGAAPAAPAADGSAAPTDLNFYNSVKQDQPQGMTPPAGDAAATPAAAPPVEPTPPGILVQVSALTRREDADSLVALLKERNLPVLVTSGENDALFHVVVGPYKNDAEAQKTKQLLEQDGFRPFIRR
jgi:DedD protein